MKNILQLSSLFVLLYSGRTSVIAAAVQTARTPREDPQADEGNRWCLDSARQVLPR